MQKSKEYYKLMNIYKSYEIYGSIISILKWDEQVNNTQNKDRNEYIIRLVEIRHKIITNETVRNWIKECKEKDDKNIQEIKRISDRAEKIPFELVEEIEERTRASQDAWKKARSTGDFKSTVKPLERLIESKRAEQEILGEKNIYEGMLKEHEPSLGAKEIDSLLENVNKECKNMLENIKRKDDLSLEDGFQIEKQSILSTLLSTYIGFDFKRGMIAKSDHSFTQEINNNDCRVAIHYDNSLKVGLLGTIHELGHALYHQGIERKLWGTPLGQVISTSFSESQSRLWECFIGRNREFIEWIKPIVDTLFGNKTRSMSAMELYDKINKINVDDGSRRKAADEISYNIHVYIRYKIEKMLIEEKIDVQDIPDLWNKMYESELGIKPKSGPLDDTHWWSGMFGYFPMYVVGNVIAAQVWKKLTYIFKATEFENILNWLRENIYQYGKEMGSKEIIKKIGFDSIIEKYLIEYLKTKYSE